MLKHTNITLAIFLSLTGLSMAQSKSSVKILDQYQWENRILLIFADSDSNKQYDNQISELDGHEEGLKDRDLKIFHLFSNALSRSGVQSANQEKTKMLYQEYGIENGDFTVILIGKDGTEKLRTTELLKVEKLFSVIDAMPMRQREMQHDSE